jgi:CheY-like chemotaxis protein
MIQPRSLDLNQVITDIFKILTRMIGENITLRWEPGENIGPVFMDPGQVSQILINLCMNARDAIQDAGTISIQTENVYLDTLYCLLLPDAAPGNYVRLTVTDDGHGMDPETLENIFEPFFSTKEFGAGNGLGLATIYGIIQQNKGFIQVYSQPEKGTTFTVYLPNDMAALETRTDATFTRQPERQGTILVVEDDAAILEMIETMLQTCGYTVLTAHLPGRALEVVQENSRHIDLLLTDIVMPEKSGPQLARELSAIHPDIKCLFMSGYSTDKIARQGQPDITENFIQKPFTTLELIEKIRNVLEQ